MLQHKLCWNSLLISKDFAKSYFDKTTIGLISGYIKRSMSDKELVGTWLKCLCK